VTTHCFTSTVSLKDGAADDDIHDLVGALQDLVHAAVPEVALHRVVLEVTVAAM
jgi:hypothetical protein